MEVSGRQAVACVGGPQPAGSLRCVVLSETHAWGPKLKLPKGDVLFHCGNLLFSGAALSATGAPGLKDTLMLFHGAEFRGFRWIFLVGGSQDRPLHELWAEEPEALNELLPPNAVLLQAPGELEPPLLGSCAAREPAVRACVDGGALKLLPDFTLCPPRDARPGWVIAGSGVSLAGGERPRGDAFQLREGEAGARELAAEALLTHSPDVVVTHGPPRGPHGGDQKLANAVARCKSVKAHFVAHPAREPLLFDVPGKAAAQPAEERCACQQGPRHCFLQVLEGLGLLGEEQHAAPGGRRAR